jgi:antitoxin component of RelBE/YafQ-DinJ toxin-antitoxin module
MKKVNIIIRIDSELKSKFLDKIELNGVSMSYVLREMIKNYLALGGFETEREIKTKQAALVKELQALGVK